MIIKCPNCGKKLEVNFKSKASQNIEDIKIKCPICKISSPLSSYKKIENESGDGDKTRYSKNRPEDPDTEYKTAPHQSYSSPGELKLVGSKLAFKLKEGRNVIGRKAQTSKSDIQIESNNNPSRLSREHIVINVKRIKDGRYIQDLSLYKNEVNVTLHNGQKLEYGDSYFLKDNDEIALPDDIKLKFIVPDPEKTTT